MTTNYTIEQLEAMSIEDLTNLVAEIGLAVNDDRRFLIENVLLAQRFPDFIRELQAQRQFTAS
ncbi:hypothetical protein H6G00_01270 [Leptolyngbya sp. FACHB-541]|uniref:hypothetical protein n=1 Tax=Leptolyngbya sp. FACHB-541 TaxID=2692810 RepID=UPI00168674A2|nr:hypothetical protein [Leptolyngbya sp. FACHB-541]MBD1995260.1 hypothetical protein [Leptolyngbya sp. FACHB-541]